MNKGTQSNLGRLGIKEPLRCHSEHDSTQAQLVSLKRWSPQMP